MTAEDGVGDHGASRKQYSRHRNRICEGIEACWRASRLRSGSELAKRASPSRGFLLHSERAVSLSVTPVQSWVLGPSYTPCRHFQVIGWNQWYRRTVCPSRCCYQTQLGFATCAYSLE